MSTPFATFEFFLYGNRTNRFRKDGTSVVCLKIYLAGKEKWYKTGIYLHPSQWDKRRKEVRNHPMVGKHNNYLADMLKAAKDYQLYLKQKGIPITLDRLAEFEKDDRNISFTEFFQQQLDIVRSTLAKGTHKSHKTVFRRLCEYRTCVYFQDLDYNFVQQYDKYLRDCGYSVNGAAKHHRVLKRYINQAIYCGLLEEGNNPYQRFRIKEEDSRVIFLLPEEVQQLEQLTFAKGEETLEICRDFFLYLVYTGSRYETGSRIRVGDVIETEDGIVVSKDSDKTMKQNDLSLRYLFREKGEKYSKPEKILLKAIERQEAIFGAFSRVKDLPLFMGYTNQFVNRQLKVLASRIECRDIIKKKLSTHCGRHTCATILADKVDNLAIVQDLLQHSNISTTRKYLHLSRKYLRKALNNVNWED